MARPPRILPGGKHWCGACEMAHPVSDFGPDAKRPPLYLAGRCRAAVAVAAAARRKAKIEASRPKDPTILAAELIESVREYARVWQLPVTVTPADLTPFPPVCALTLSDLIECYGSHPVALARLIESEGFTPENTLIVSARSRGRSRAVGAERIVDNLRRELPAVSVAVLTEALGRHNVMKWPETLAEVIDGLDALTVVEIRMVSKWTVGERRTSPDGLAWNEGHCLEWTEGTKVLGFPPEGFTGLRRVYPMGLAPENRAQARAGPGRRWVHR